MKSSNNFNVFNTYSKDISFTKVNRCAHVSHSNENKESEILLTFSIFKELPIIYANIRV